MTANYNGATAPATLTLAAPVQFITYAVPANGRAASATKTKIQNAAGGWDEKKWGKDKAATLPCATWKLERRPVAGVADLFNLVKEAETAGVFDETPGVILRCELVDGVAGTIGTRKREDRLIDGKKVFNNFLPLDIDTSHLPKDWTDAEKADTRKCALWARAGLPAWLLDAGCVAQKTSSHGIKDGIRMRLNFLTDRPMNPAEIFAAFGSMTPALDGAALGVDHNPALDVSVFGFTAVSFVAAPIFENVAGKAMQDPIAGPRSVLIEGSVAVVPAADVLEAAAHRLGISLVEDAYRRMSAPGGVQVDAPHVLDRARTYLAKGNHRPALGGVRIWLGRTANKLMDFGCDAETAVDLVIENAGDACTRPDDDKEWALAYCSFRVGSIGSDYKPKADHTGASFGAVDEADEVGPARAKAPEVSPVFAFNFNIYARPGQGARYLLQDFFPNIPGEVGSIWGSSSAGKTTIACGIAAALATKADFLGKKNRAGRPIGVLFVSGESWNDTGRSFAALQKRGALPLGSPVLHVEMPEISALQAMIDAADAKLIAETGTPLGVVFFDTLTRCFQPMFDAKGQNAVEPHAALTKMLAELANAKGRKLCMWTIDHLGKDLTRGALGSEAKSFNAAAIVGVTKARGTEIGEAHVIKIKGAPDNLPELNFSIGGEFLFEENINQDEGGEPEIERIYGAVVRLEAAPVALKPLKAKQATVLGVLAAFGVRGLSDAEWLAESIKAGVAKTTATDAMAALSVRKDVRTVAGRRVAVTKLDPVTPAGAFECVEDSDAA